MDKIKRPRGLIRYASLNSIEKSIRSGSDIKSKWKFTPREMGYSALLTVLVYCSGYSSIEQNRFQRYNS